MIIVIDFDGHLKAEIQIIDEEVKVLRAVDGWGNVVNCDNVEIEKQ